MKTIFLVPLLLCGCGASPEGANSSECLDDLDNDGDGLYDCADPDCAGSVECGASSPSVPPPIGGSAGTNNPGLVCDFEGTFQLQSITCDGVSATAEWGQNYTSSTLSVADDGTGFGTCTMTLQLASPLCATREDFRLLSGEGAMIQMWFDGISFCDPGACAHTPDHDVCTIGDRNWGGPYPLNMTGGSGITFTDLFAPALPTCIGTVTSVWQ
jgi:hypothetical protein